MGKLDALSCWADHPQGMDNNMDMTLLCPEWFKLQVMEEVTLEGGEMDLLERIQRGKDYGEKVVKAWKELGWGSLCSEEWDQDGDLTLYWGWVCIPKDPACHIHVFPPSLHSLCSTSGHSGSTPVPSW